MPGWERALISKHVFSSCVPHALVQHTAAHKKNAETYAASGRELGATLPHPFPIQAPEPHRHPQMLLPGGAPDQDLSARAASLGLQHHWTHKLDELHSLLHHLHHGQPMSMCVPHFSSGVQPAVSRFSLYMRQGLTCAREGLKLALQ